MLKEIKIGKCPSCEDDNVLIQVDDESGQVIINNLEQGGEWKDQEGNSKVFIGRCSNITKEGEDGEDGVSCNQIIGIRWYSDGQIIAFYVAMGRRRYTSHCFSGEFASSEDLGGRNSIYLETEIDGGELLLEDIWVENMTGRVKMDMDIPASIFGKVKVAHDMGSYMTTAVEPLNGVVAIVGAALLLQPIMSDIVGICDIKCEENPDGSNDEGCDFESYTKLKKVVDLLTELTAEFVRVNNEVE